MCVKVLLQYSNVVQTTSRTGHLSLARSALINTFLQEVNCSTFCRFLCFYWLRHVRVLETIKTSSAWRANALGVIIKRACSHGRTHRLYTYATTHHVLLCEVSEAACAGSALDSSSAGNRSKAAELQIYHPTQISHPHLHLYTHTSLTHTNPFEEKNTHFTSDSYDSDSDRVNSGMQIGQYL